MVKKIQIVDQQDTTTEELDAADFQTKILEILQAIDWKLWELYKIEQERQLREDAVSNKGMQQAKAEVESTIAESEPEPKKSRARRKPKAETEATGLEYKPVRVKE